MDDHPVKILLVEDNEDDVIMTLEAFREAKLTNVVQVVHDGEEAIAFLRREDAYQSVMTPDLILLDINMPKKNGFEVLQEIKADPCLRDIPVVMLTTSERENDIARSFAEGACSYITKPVEFEQFVEVVQQFSLYWTLVTRVPKRES